MSSSSNLDKFYKNVLSMWVAKFHSKKCLHILENINMSLVECLFLNLLELPCWHTLKIHTFFMSQMKWSSRIKFKFLKKYTIIWSEVFLSMSNVKNVVSLSTKKIKWILINAATLSIEFAQFLLIKLSVKLPMKHLSWEILQWYKVVAQNQRNRNAQNVNTKEPIVTIMFLKKFCQIFIKNMNRISW